MESKKRNRFSKKIICIVATLAMVVAMMPMSAFADTEGIPITEVKIASLDTPVAGMPVSIEDVTVTTTPAKEEALGAWEQSWYDETIGETATGVFIAGHEYTQRVILTAKLGYCFKEEGADQCQVYADYDESHSVSVNSLGRYELRVIGNPVKPIIPVTEVKITSLDTPVVGESVVIKDVTVETTPAAEDIFAVKASGWYDETSGAWAEDVFLAGHEYSLRVILTAKLGYCFEEEGAKQCQVYANFDESHSISASSQGSYTLTVTGEPVKAATPVTGVRIMDVQTPVSGLSCSTKLINIAYSPKNGLGSWNFEWYDETTKEVKSATDTFEKGHIYSLHFKATSDEGYGFKFDENSAYTGKVTVNGLPAAEVVKSKEDTDTIVGKSGSFIAQPLKAPKSVSVKLCGYDDIKASWSKVTGATGYKVYFKKSTASSNTYKETTNVTYKSLKNLTDGAKYFVKVVPYATVAGKTVTGPAKVSSGIYTLKKLNTPAVSKKSSGKVTVKWNNINGETGYQISKSTKKTGTNIVATCKTTTGKSKVLTVKKNKTYYYKVRAFKTVDGKKIYAPWSSVKSFTLR